MNTDRYIDTTIEIPVRYVKDELSNGEECYVIIDTPECKKIFDGQPFVSQGKTLEHAKQRFLDMITSMYSWNEHRSRELDKYKWFQKGDWSSIGGSWFTILGLNWYFRTGDGMKGGRYIPFTKLNISFCNHWRIKIKKDDKEETTDNS